MTLTTNVKQGRFYITKRTSITATRFGDAVQSKMLVFNTIQTTTRSSSTILREL